ncbi:MAG: glycosyltransferase 87 family protein [Solirubrobacteraceae bacterium]
MSAAAQPAGGGLARLGRSVWAPAAVLVVLWCVATAVGPTSDTGITDLGLYREYGEHVAAGAVPYREFFVEYPPLALVPMWLAGLPGGGADGYEVAFGALMLAAALVVLVLCARLARDRAAVAAWAVALAPLAAGASVRTHFDLLPVALALGGLLALTRARPGLAFGLLGAGAMAKVFPAVLVPVGLAWLAGRREWRGAGRGLAAFVAVVAAISLPFLGSGYVDAYRFHVDRPLQIESTGAVALLVAGTGTVTGVQTPVPNDFRSNAVEGRTADALAAAGLVLLAAALAFACWRAWARSDERGLLLAAAAALLAFMAFGKVFSPQFALWLVPVVALAAAGREWLLAGFAAGAIVLTQVEFPSRYFDLVARDPGVIALVAARDALVLAALSVCLARLAAPARSRRLAAAPTP